MKKILLAILSLITIACYSQTTGHLRYDSVRIYRMGGNAELILESATRDSLGFLYNYGNGRTRFEVIRGVPGGIKVGGDTINVISSSGNRLISGGEITYTGTGFTFTINAAVYEIDFVRYNSPGGSFTLAASDPTLNRQDVVYLGTDNNFHVLQGTAATPAAIPQVDGDQLPLTSISIPAGSTTPGITTTVIYDENTESIVTNSGTTTDPNNATNTFQGAKSVNVTNINNGDFVFFDTDGTPPTWSLANIDALSLHLKLKAVMPTPGRLWVQFFNGLTAASSEVSMAFDHFNTTTYQAISVPISAFGTITNYNITRVRLRYSSSDAVNYTGFYVDYMFLVDGIVQGGNGAVNQVALSMPSAFTVTGSPGTGNVSLNVTGAGNSTQYIDGTGALTAFPPIPINVGLIAARSPNANRAMTVDGDSIFLDSVSSTTYGVATPDMYNRVYRTYYIQNANSPDDDSLVYPFNDTITRVKQPVAGANMTITSTDTTLIFASTGGGGGGRFGVSGEDDTGAEDRIFETGAANLFTIRRTGGTTTQGLTFYDDQNVQLFSDGAAVNVGGGVGVTFTGPIFTVNGLIDPPGTTNKMMVWDSTDARWYVTAIPTGGGGGSPLFPLTGTGTASGNVVGDLNGNTLTVFSGGQNQLVIDPVGFTTNLNATDGTAGSGLGLNSDLVGTNVNFSLTASNGVNTVGVVGNPIANSLTSTADSIRFVHPNFITIADSATNYMMVQNKGTGTIGKAFWPAGGANTALSNLASVAINTPLLPSASNTHDFGSTTLLWKDAWAYTFKARGSTSGTVTYSSDALANAPNVTTNSGTGYGCTCMEVRETSDFTGQNIATVQPVFNTAQDVWPLQAATAYDFEALYMFNHGATSHQVGLSFELSGGATITSITYTTLAWVTAIGAQTTTQTSNVVQVATNVVVNGAGANATENIIVKGTINMNAAGNVTPSYTFSAQPGGTALTKAGSYIKFCPKGTNVFTTIGPAQ